MNRCPSVGLWIAFAAAAGLLCIGTRFIFKSRDWGRQFDRWLVEEPVRLRMDLAVRGKCSAPYVQTCAISHAQSAVLVPLRPEDLPRVRQAVDSVAISIMRPGDTGSYAIDKGRLLEGPEGGAEVMRLSPVRNGAYTLVAEVTKPAQGGTLPADLVIRNELCGLEQMPGLMYAVIGWPLAVIGGAVGLVAGLRARRALTPSRSP